MGNLVYGSPVRQAKEFLARLRKADAEVNRMALRAGASFPGWRIDTFSKLEETLDEQAKKVLPATVSRASLNYFSRPLLERVWFHFGPNLGPSWGQIRAMLVPCGPKNQFEKVSEN